MSVSQFFCFALSIKFVGYDYSYNNLIYDLITRAVGEHYQKRKSPQQLTVCGQQSTVCGEQLQPSHFYHVRLN